MLDYVAHVKMNSTSHVRFENVSGMKDTFVMENVQNLSDLMQRIVALFPSPIPSNINFRISDKQAGFIRPRYFVNDLPADVVDLFITVRVIQD